MKSLVASDRVSLELGDCLEGLRALPSACIDAVITDPPYAEIDRPYGRLTEGDWHALMREVVHEVRRVLVPAGSAVFILQPNSERVGRMRPWLFEFMAEIARGWNLIQDVWWWNHTTPPTVHCQEKYGLLRPSLKACVWAGAPESFRNQGAVLWTPSEAMAAVRREDRSLRRHPSGQHMRRGRIAETVDARGGVTPFNVIPLSNGDSRTSGGARGHGAATPGPLCDWWIRYITKPAGVVLDPFAGSGTIGLRALALGRAYVGFEAHEEYAQEAARALREVGSAA